jgi:8-oxo-dGTP pyrophosphatase MutT (NUDIX family)
MDKDLIWTERSRKKVFNARIFSLSEIQSKSPHGEDGVFSVIESNDWAIIIPLLERGQTKEFVMVKQWRHGAKELSVEFPGGVIEKGENMVEGAKRELREETGYIAGKMTLLASMSPNPAIMANNVHFFLAENLEQDGAQKLDKDEFIEIVHEPVDEVIANMGKAPYRHALMASALCYWMKKT